MYIQNRQAIEVYFDQKSERIPITLITTQSIELIKGKSSLLPGYKSHVVCQTEVKPDFWSAYLEM